MAKTIKIVTAVVLGTKVAQVGSVVDVDNDLAKRLIKAGNAIGWELDDQVTHAHAEAERLQAVANTAAAHAKQLAAEAQVKADEAKAALKKLQGGGADTKDTHESLIAKTKPELVDIAEALEIEVTNQNKEELVKLILDKQHKK